ncbi:hypothetical protein M5K25_014624 [Dendrobium thyrsiflorum]|uniref:Uncharacterized protein n=1 Tax=Dendrobium thyrsiflorum TaxID=117978 RepID=A0ABD0UNS4_DENTH
MADPERDFGMTYDEQGYVHILHSTFFDVELEVDHTVEGYVARILDTLVDAIKEQLGKVQWHLASDPPQGTCHQTAQVPQSIALVSPSTFPPLQASVLGCEHSHPYNSPQCHAILTDPEGKQIRNLERPLYVSQPRLAKYLNRDLQWKEEEVSRAIHLRV